MGKALRVFVIILLLLSIGSLVLGIMLFNKRELLKGRTRMLEEYLIKVASTVEKNPPEEAEAPGDPERDISPVTSEPIANPDRARFWEDYGYPLEKTDNDLLLLNEKRNQLMQYYKIDPITQKVERDATYGHKVTEGKGTMKALLEDTLAKAEAQYNRLNETREELRALREELVSTINDLNATKSRLRDRLSHIVSLNRQIAGLEQQIDDLNQRIALLEEEKRDLQDDLAERDRTIEERDQTITKQEVAIRRLETRIRDLERNITRDVQEVVSGAVFVEPGDKGQVAAVNDQWNFAVLKFSPEFINELLGDDRSKPLPRIDLMLKRPDGEFVTKVRLTQLKVEEGLGIADVLSPWQQLPVKPGDIVFY